MLIFKQEPQTGSPLSGTFVGAQETNHGHVDAVHAVEEWSDDEHHIKPIVDNTLYYNDLLRVKFKKKHDDGRKPEHSGTYLSTNQKLLYTYINISNMVFKACIFV